MTTILNTYQDAAHHRDILNTLIDQGAALAARIHATATAATTPDSALPEATIAFDRIARAVRRTIALARHIATPPAATAGSPATTAATPATTPDARTKTRTHLIRAVEDAIDRQHRVYDGNAQELQAELAERLEDPELELDLQGRDIEEVIQEICRDLGIAHQARSYIWRRRTPADLKDLRTRAAAPPQTLHLIQGGRPPPA